MKKFILFTLLTVVCLSAFSVDATAQRRKKKSSTDQYFDESGFVNKLWFGGGFVLGFAGSGEVNQFSIGLTPMVGYKVFEDIVSVGPRIGYVFNTVKGRGTDLNIYRVNPSSFTLGAFARIKAFPNFFAHMEYENENTKNYFVDGRGLLVIENGEVLTVQENRDNVYLGVGYNSGGLWGYEIVLLYNVNEPDNTVDLPIDLRFGITYKF